MSLGPIPDYLKQGMRRHFLESLKGSRSLDTYELDLFQWFWNETEETWARMDTEEQQYIQEQVDLGVEDINASGILVTDYYCRRMRASHIIFLSSLLEAAMKRECDRVMSALGDQILFKPSELKGDPWSARRTFLERHGAFCIPDNIWKPIRDLLAVRNILAHQNGDTSLFEGNQLSQLNNISGIVIDPSEIGIEVRFVGEALKAVRDVVDFLHARITELIDDKIMSAEKM